VNQTHAIQQFNQFDRKGRYVFNMQDISKLFAEDTKRALQAGIQRLVKHGILLRATKGVFIYALSQHQHNFPLEQIAKTMRRGEYSYLSLESALSEYGVISQIPMGRITVMTTGRKGEYKTPFGTIEFTHTQRTPVDIVNNSTLVGRPLRIATKQAAYRDLKRVGRNIHLVDEASIHEN
jgi:predicted transcriptional regulator of viral defense system